jgi:hypothetical protein
MRLTCDSRCGPILALTLFCAILVPGTAIAADQGSTIIKWPSLTDTYGVQSRSLANSIYMQIDGGDKESSFLLMSDKGATLTNMKRGEGIALDSSRSYGGIARSADFETNYVSGKVLDGEPESLFYAALGVGTTVELPGTPIKVFGVQITGCTLRVQTSGIELVGKLLPRAGGNRPPVEARQYACAVGHSSLPSATRGSKSYNDHIRCVNVARSLWLFAGMVDAGATSGERYRVRASELESAVASIGKTEEIAQSEIDADLAKFARLAVDSYMGRKRDEDNRLRARKDYFYCKAAGLVS